MNTPRHNLLAIFLTVVGLPAILDSLLPSRPALGATFKYNFNVNVNGRTLGNIGLNEALGLGDKGLGGYFTPTGRTIPELLEYLSGGDPSNKPDHLKVSSCNQFYLPPHCFW